MTASTATAPRPETDSDNKRRGVVYLNNRYHNPQLGGFISVDPLVVKTGEAYIYSSGNPITFSDSTGLETFADMTDPRRINSLIAAIEADARGDTASIEAMKQAIDEHHDKPGVDSLFKECSVMCAGATVATGLVFGSLTAVACPSGTIATAGFGAVAACGGMVVLTAAATSSVREKLSDDPPDPDVILCSMAVAGAFPAGTNAPGPVRAVAQKVANGAAC